MYQTKYSNLIIACPFVFLAALYVPAPVQSQHPYGLISAIVDKENPNDGQDEFTLYTHTTIEYAYVDDGISQVWAQTPDGTVQIARFRSVDYHTMISNVVIFDTGDPNRVVKCEFRDQFDAEEFYELIKPNFRPFHMMMFGVNSVLQYDGITADRENAMRDDRLYDESYHCVSPKGTIYIETRAREVDDRPVTKRFVIRGEDSTVNMVFTSKTFNMTPLGRNDNVMMAIKIKYLVFKVLIRFENVGTARNFLDHVRINDDLDRNIPLYIPNVWRDLF